MHRSQYLSIMLMPLPTSNNASCVAAEPHMMHCLALLDVFTKFLIKENCLLLISYLTVSSYKNVPCLYKPVHAPLGQSCSQLRAIFAGYSCLFYLPWSSWPWPSSMLKTCNMPGNRASSDSDTARGLPGKLTITVFPLMPATPLESIEVRVRFCP
jgi:hypothetical protein